MVEASGGSPLGKRYCHFHGGRAVPQPGRRHSPDGPGVSLGVASPRFCNGISFWEIIARQHPSPKRSLQMAVVERGPTQVQRVLAKGPIADPFATLEEARNDPDRLERIRQIRKLIDERGIKYIFFQQVSISGHVNGKGVVATQWENVAENGYQLVYGATADLFVDRHDRYIGFGPEESELAAVADLDTFAQLPWDPRVARVFCDCYDTESGELLESDPRQNLKRIMNEVEQELGYTFLCGIEPEMMWMRKTDDPNEASGLTKPWCYHIN